MPTRATTLSPWRLALPRACGGSWSWLQRGRDRGWRCCLRRGGWRCQSWRRRWLHDNTRGGGRWLRHWRATQPLNSDVRTIPEFLAKTVRIAASVLTSRPSLQGPGVPSARIPPKHLHLCKVGLVSAIIPASIARRIVPLESASTACEAERQLVAHLMDVGSVPRSRTSWWHVPPPWMISVDRLAIRVGVVWLTRRVWISTQQNMLVQTLLSRGLAEASLAAIERVVAETKLVVTPMVSSQFHYELHCITLTISCLRCRWDHEFLLCGRRRIWQTLPWVATKSMRPWSVLRGPHLVGSRHHIARATALKAVGAVFIASF